MTTVRFLRCHIEPHSLAQYEKMNDYAHSIFPVLGIYIYLPKNTQTKSVNLYLAPLQLLNSLIHDSYVRVFQSSLAINTQSVLLNEELIDKLAMDVFMELNPFEQWEVKK